MKRIALYMPDGMSTQQDLETFFKDAILTEGGVTNVGYYYEIIKQKILLGAKELVSTIENSGYELLLTPSITSSLNFYAKFNKEMATIPNELVFKKRGDVICIFKNDEVFKSIAGYDTNSSFSHLPIEDRYFNLGEEDYLYLNPQVS